MRVTNFIVETREFLTQNIVKTTHRGSCFQNCKGAKFFAYDFKSEDIYKFMGKEVSIADHIKYVLELTRAAIQEFDISVTIRHNLLVLLPSETKEIDGVEGAYSTIDIEKNNCGHRFTIECTGEHSNYNVYLAVIFSRFFNCADHSYSGIIASIYKIRPLGYTPMEAYLIACNHTGYPSYSFCGKGIYDIEVYRALPNKKVLLDSKNSINSNFSKLCLLQKDQTGNLESDLQNNIEKASGEQLVAGYQNDLNSMKANIRNVLKINIEKFKDYFGIQGNVAHHSFYSWSDPRNYLGKLMENPYYEAIDCSGMSEFHVAVFTRNISNAQRSFCGRKLDEKMLDIFEVVDIQEYIRHNANKIYDDYLTPKKISISDNWRTSNLRRMFSTRCLDITDEINSTKALPVKLKKTKALAK